MKKRTLGLFICLLLLTFLFDLSGCSTINSAGTETAEPEQTVEIPESSEIIETDPTPDISLEGKTISEDGLLGDWIVVIAGAQKSEFSDGQTALLLYYDFTNNSTESISPFLALDISAYQQGEKLNSIHTFDEVPYQGNSGLYVRPDTTIRCSALYEYTEDNGEVSIQISDWTGDASVVVYEKYNVKDLPGEIGTYETAAVDSVSITDSLPREAEMDGCFLSIHSEAAKTTDWDGAECIRISVDLSNNGESDKNFSEDFTAIAYQDGIELETAFASDSVPEDNNSWADIQPGSTVTLSMIYELRSDNPVEIEVLGSDGAKIGTKYSLEQ